MTAIEYIKDKFTGKTISLYDCKTKKKIVDTITIISIDSDKKEVQFMEKDGDPEWDVLTGSYYLSVDKEEEIIVFYISEANWNIEIFTRYSTGEYLAIERF